MANPLYDGLFGVHTGKTTPFLHLLNGHVITHRDFLSTASQIANVATQIGLKPGDRVAVQVEKSPEALALYAACAQAGLVFLPLNTAYTVDELSFFIENSGASLIVCDGKSKEKLDRLAAELGEVVAKIRASR